MRRSSLSRISHRGHRAWQRYRSLARADRRLLWSMVLLVPIIEGWLRCFGYKSACRMLQRFGAMLAAPIEGGEALAEIERHQRLLFLIYRDNNLINRCLSRALALRWLLRRRGIETELRIGVRKLDGQFQSHAWIEYQGQSLAFDRSARHDYIALPRQFRS